MASVDKRRVMIVAGEASGDLHGAKVIRAARDLDPGLRFFGMGGEQMAAAGCDLRVGMGETAVMGLLEVATKLPAIRRAFRRLKTLLQGPERPDLVVLIDFPGFNLRLAKAARRAGVPVLYYICPKIWASRPGRIEEIVRNVDRLAVIFPFEQELFTGRPIEVDFVGNPLLDDFHEPAPRGEVLARCGFDAERPVVGLFPGSRKSEIRHILPTILETAARLRQERPEVQFVAPLAKNLDTADVEPAIHEHGVDVVLVREDIYDISAACDVILSVSGTVTLQIALTATPMVIVYKSSALTYAIARRLVRIPLVGLPNIVAGREIVKEYIQDEARPESLRNEMNRLLSDQAGRDRVKKQLVEVKTSLGEAGCSHRVAQIILEMLARNAGDRGSC